jgi:hypothetical protein
LDHATEKIWSQPAETMMSPAVEAKLGLARRVANAVLICVS